MSKVKRVIFSDETNNYIIDLFNKNIKLEDIAREVGVSQNYIAIYIRETLKLKIEPGRSGMSLKFFTTIPELNEIIMKEWNKDTKLDVIATKLNKKNFQTMEGKEWTKNTVSRYALNKMYLQKRKEYIVNACSTKKEEKIFYDNVDEKTETFYSEPQPIETETKEETKQEPNYNLDAINIYEKNGLFFTNSRAVAEVFGKRHDNVLRAISNLECTTEFRKNNFVQSSYINSQNKEQPMIELTKDGFALLVFGFTGSKVIEIKIFYIQKFNEMEEASKIKEQEPNFNPSAIAVYEKNGKFWTDSKAVAEVFGKEHKNVLQSIKELLLVDDPEFNELNFQPVTYTDKKGEARPMYLLTKDSFAILAMGFTGSKALEFKKAYMKKFNEMEKELKSKAPKNFSAMDLMKLTLQGFEEQDQKLNEATKRLDDKINGSIADIDQKLNQTISNVDLRVKEVLTGIETNQNTFFDPPAPSVILPIFDTERGNCHSLVNRICGILKVQDHSKGCQKIYNKAYETYNQMFETNVGRIASIKGITKLEAVTLYGKVEALYAIIYELYTQALQNNTKLLKELNLV